MVTELKMPKKIYCPLMLPTEYQEPALLPDQLEYVDTDTSDFGLALWKEKEPLPPHTDIHQFQASTKGELMQNLNLFDTPLELHKEAKQIARAYWDVF